MLNHSNQRKMTIIKSLCFWLLSAVLWMSLPLSAAPPKKIILIAGKDSHGDGAHEFLAGCQLLKDKLEEALGDQVDVMVVPGGWPKNPNIFDGAAATVIYSDGLGRHPLNGHFDVMDQWVKKGMGVAMMHFACDVDAGVKGEKFKQWIGGHYEKGFSTNPHWVCESLLADKHPIASGCQGFKLKDEWYFNMRWSDSLKHTAVLQGIPDRQARSGKTSSPRVAMPHIVEAEGRKETLLWSVERPDGGRGFGFTGGHYHSNWRNDEFRKLILNAIAWLARIEIPDQGLVTRTPNQQEMQLHTKRERKQRKKTGRAGQPVLFRSQTIRAHQSVEIDVDLKQGRRLVLVVEDADGSINYDHANWVNPRLVGSAGELPLTQLQWASATAGFGRVRVGEGVGGEPIVDRGRKVANAIGTHSNSVIVYDIPQGYDRFRATGVMSVGSKGRGSVVFVVDKQAPEKLASVPAESFQVVDDLEVTVWAQSPMFYNPTNIDIDAQGRIWVAEGLRYRTQTNSKMDVKHPEGDRIMVLNDSNGDGKADQSHCFVQDKDLVAPLGVAVIGKRVIVSQPPSLIVYTDVDGDARFDPAVDTKENFLTGFSGLDHDHSLHSVTMGPDGEYYFNQGNAGYSEVKDRDGKVFRVGSSYSGGGVKFNQPGKRSDDGFVYVGGFACRVKPDGSGLSVIGHNFRNSYEQSVSSFGDVFQNDNDDPPACRTSWLMEYGNTGFASADGSRTWKADRRPGQSTAVAEWRQEDPGVMPAGDVYGGGSPTGIVFYENGALGRQYEGLLLSCEAGNRELLGYFPTPEGAGFKLERFSFLNSHTQSAKARWFRPSDVAVGADGALYVADWFDPAVGGHKMSDRGGSGTIYRIAPRGFKPRNPRLDLDSIDGMVAALQSPAVHVRALAILALKECGDKAIPALRAMLNDPNRYFRARAIWVLSQLGPQGVSVVEPLLQSGHVQTRVVAYRALRRQNHQLLSMSRQLADDPSAAVRREVALAMREFSLVESQEILLRIAEQYDGRDRWYLEALGTGCANKEAAMYELLHARLGSDALRWDARFEGIAWRLHSPAAVNDFRTRAMTSSLDVHARKRMLVALAFADSREAAEAMLMVALTGPRDLRGEAAWWVQNKSYSSWKDYGLLSQLKSKKLPKPEFDLAKHLTVDNGSLPPINRLLEMKGDAKAGKKLFYGKGICFSCHRMNGKGRDLGPDLSGIGKRFEDSALLDSMINPSSAISFGFETVTVEKRDGTRVQGFVVADADPLLLKDLAGVTHSVDRKQIKNRDNMKASIMPSVKNLALSAEEVRNILEYIKQN